MGSHRTIIIVLLRLNIREIVLWKVGMNAMRYQLDVHVSTAAQAFVGNRLTQRCPALHDGEVYPVKHLQRTKICASMISSSNYRDKFPYRIVLVMSNHCHAYAQAPCAHLFLKDAKFRYSCF